jgi:hypothetical protein
MSHSEQLKKDLNRIADILEKRSKLFERMVKVTEDEELEVIYLTLATLCYFLGRSCLVSVNTLNEINVLFKAIEKLPRKSEFDEIKNMLEKQRENIVNTLIPIKDAFERSTEYENFGRKMKERKKRGE